VRGRSYFHGDGHVLQPYVKGVPIWCTDPPRLSYEDVWMDTSTSGRERKVRLRPAGLTTIARYSDRKTGYTFAACALQE